MREVSHTYRVYVIERVLPSGSRALYVGQSALTPLERLYQHAGGKRYCQRCSKRTYVHGPSGTKLILRSDLARMVGRSFATRSEAERAERWLAGQLRGMGFKVKGGH